MNTENYCFFALEKYNKKIVSKCSKRSRVDYRDGLNFLQLLGQPTFLCTHIIQNPSIPPVNSDIFHVELIDQHEANDNKQEKDNCGHNETRLFDVKYLDLELVVGDVRIEKLVLEALDHCSNELVGKEEEGLEQHDEEKENQHNDKRDFTQYLSRLLLQL